MSILILVIICVFGGHAASETEIDPRCIMVKCSSIKREKTTYSFSAGIDIYGVKLMKELSKATCFPGESYGIIGRQSMWIDRGCRGVFRICTRNDSRICEEMQCSSHQDRIASCSVKPGFSVVSIKVKTVNSKTPCFDGFSYGYSENLIWVMAGCSATFQVCSVPANPVIVCSSFRKNRYVCLLLPEYKNRKIINSELIETKSSTKCDYSNHGSTGASVWLDDGCRGTFRLNTIQDNSVCQNVTCAANNGKHLKHCATFKGLRIANVYPIGVHYKCQPEHFGFKPRYLWVDRKCHGRYRVCSVVDTPKCADVLCGTTNNITRFCRVQPDMDVFQIELLMEDSDNVCNVNSSFGIVPGYSFMYVNHGCKGLFHVCGLPKIPIEMSLPETFDFDDVDVPFTVQPPLNLLLKGETFSYKTDLKNHDFQYKNGPVSFSTNFKNFQLIFDFRGGDTPDTSRQPDNLPDNQPDIIGWPDYSDMDDTPVWQDDSEFDLPGPLDKYKWMDTSGIFDTPIPLDKYNRLDTSFSFDNTEPLNEYNLPDLGGSRSNDPLGWSKIFGF